MELSFIESYITTLLAFVPAVINLGIIFYIVFKLPKSKTTDIFIFIVMAVVLWQMEDTLMRNTDTKEMARFWDSIFCLGWLLIGPLVFHFSIRYASIHKLQSRRALFLIYAPFVFFYVMYHANLQGAVYVHIETWGWLNKPRRGTLEEIQRYCISIMIIASVIILLHNAIGIKSNKNKKMQAWIIAVGILLPSIQGILTQVAFPLFFSVNELPVTSSFMSLFSFATIIALNKYKLFQVSDSVQSDSLLENLNRIVLIISPDKKILYMNQFAANVFGISSEHSESICFSKLFPTDDLHFKEYSEEIFEKVLMGHSVNNYASTFMTSDGTRINVILASSLIVNNKIKQGVLLLANDITKMVKALKDLELERLRSAKDIAEASIVAQEVERKTIGGELHDNVNQILASSLMYLGMVKREAKLEHPYFKDVANLIRSAIDEIRTLSHSLIAPSLNESELAVALDKIINVARKTGQFKVEMDLNGIDEDEIPEILKLNIYRIVQEQFNNIIKYVKAKSVFVKISQTNDKLMLNINDDGVGFDTSKSSEGRGITNMKNRVLSNNGEININSSQGMGCELAVVFETIKSEAQESVTI